MKSIQNDKRSLRFLVAAMLIGCAPFGHAADEEMTPFPKELLGQPEGIAAGKGVFGQICKFCHGKSAYPGKAPKLNPSRYTPEFVYDRVTNGYRGMPSFREQFSEQERQAVVVYVLSREFSN